MRFLSGLSLLVRDRRGGLYFAVYQPPRSRDWHWRISLTRYRYGEPRYFFRMDRAAGWAQNIRWNDYLHVLWLIKFRIGHRIREDDGAPGER
jgi:hypothetical protein